MTGQLPGCTWAQGMNLKKGMDEVLGLEVLVLLHWEEYEARGCWQPPSLPGEGRKGPRPQPGKTWQGHLGHQMKQTRMRQGCWQLWWVQVEVNDVFRL